MKLTLAIDPGVRGCGAAWFEDGTLTSAMYLRTTDEESTGAKAWWRMVSAFRDYTSSVDTLVLEVPQVYRMSKGDPNDLVAVAGTAGAIIGAYYELAQDVVSYLPRQWKGNVPKAVHNQRVLADLTATETKSIQYPKQASLKHNVIDAIGLGVFHLRSLRRAA